MSTYAKVRSDLQLNWAGIGLRNLEGEGIELDSMPTAEWLRALCCDTDLGIYVLTENDDSYFTANSIDLELKEMNS